MVCLKKTVDRSLVPSRDFVLHIRDDAISTPTFVSTISPSQRQAINVAILPDSRSDLVKERVRREIQARLQGQPDSLVDFTPGVKYERSKQEKLEDEDAQLQLDEAAELDDEDTSRKEYIFLIDRSGSMHGTISLARESLMLFL